MKNTKTKPIIAWAIRDNIFPFPFPSISRAIKGEELLPSCIFEKEIEALKALKVIKAKAKNFKGKLKIVKVKISEINNA